MGLFDAFKRGLSKTRDKLVAGMRRVLAFGRKIDEELLEELADTMLAGDMGPKRVYMLQDELRAAWKAGKIREAQEILPFLKQRVTEMWATGDREIKWAPEGPTVILIVGINGSGKTTSVAKLAQKLTNEGKKVLLGACDTFRAAAIEQLTIWAQRCGVEIVKHQHGSDPSAVAFDACEAGVARGVDVILIDTAGRLHTQDHLMKELDKIKRVISRKIPNAPHETILVLDATIGQNAVNQARMFAQCVPVTGVFLAKLDGSARGGAVVSIRDELDIPVKFVGLGEGYDDIEKFDPATFVEAMFPEE
ncbi:MAG: signal recognition particle-docking protein FtsY [Phycisphaerales bacterium]|nr:signal recognition particle-docking protein FtsY [Phycisphaerales bacterium]